MRCRNCKEKFIPVRFLQKYCDKEECKDIEIKVTLEKVRKQKTKEEKKATNLLKESLKTKSDYIKILQILVNKYIRQRDLGKQCISCDTILTEKIKYDAGHMYPTTYQFLRFNEDNIAGQCVRCNRDLHGNISEYRPKMEQRIGVDKMQWLHAHRHDRFEMTIPELQEKIKEYKLKLKNNG